MSGNEDKKPIHGLGESIECDFATLHAISIGQMTRGSFLRVYRFATSWWADTAEGRVCLEADSKDEAMAEAGRRWTGVSVILSDGRDIELPWMDETVVIVDGPR